MSKTILITNDDGIDSNGIRTLAKALRGIAHTRVVVVAPDREKSAASHSLTLHRPLRLVKLAKDFYCVDGTPTDAVTVGVHQVLARKVDLVVSGINRGGNLGDDVHYSGTVAAATEAALMGIPAIAVSVVALEKFKYQTAAIFAVKLVRKVLKAGLPKGVVLNVNVPSLPMKSIKGYAFTRQGKRNYGDLIVQKIDPRGRPYFWISGDPTKFEDIPNSDCNALVENYITVTPINIDMTDDKFLKTLSRWKL